MIETLQKCRATFGRMGRLEKLRLIRTIKCAELKKPDQIRTYHNLLLFLVAYPDNAQLLDIAESELNRIAELVRQDRDKGRLTARLANTGIANTELVYPFSIEMAAWLTRRLPNDVEIDLTDDELCKQVDAILHQVVASVEGAIVKFR